MTKTKIFVFGSNLAGRHGKGAALYALNNHGAIYGLGEGRQGNSYAIPTKDCNLRSLPLYIIENHVTTFISYVNMMNKAREINGDNLELEFQVTRVGCGLAGYTDKDISPMFQTTPENCILPIGWRGDYRGERKGE